MLPLRDHNPSQGVPFVTYSIIVLCILVWFYEAFFVLDVESFFVRWALQPGEIMTGQAYGTFLTSIFLHGGFMHLAGNMLFLKIFGDNLESRMGHVLFLLFYLISGIAASIAQIWMNPTSMIPMVGASGAIAGVMGAYLILYPKAKVDTLMPAGFGIVALPAFTMLGYWFLAQLLSGTLTYGAEGGGVAYGAHIGGFIAGFILILPWRWRT